MVFVLDKKFACATCIKGHRSSSCQHTDRPLFAIRAKGRPVSQCEHCRELRKTKQVHVKCECDSKNPLGLNGTGPIVLEPGTEIITARKGARKVKTLEPQKPVFPNGIQDMEEAIRILNGMSEGSSVDLSACTCNYTGVCDCCTDRYEKKGKTKGHANRPSISLTIPETSENELSSPSRSPRGISPGRRGHSRSPSRTHPNHTEEGHQAGGGPETGHVRHVSLYSPYELPAHLPQTNHNGGSPDASQIYSPSSAPGSTSMLLAPQSFGYRDTSSAPPSPLSPDMDRPRSALSIHTGGRITPVDFAAVPSSPVNPGVMGDWGGMGDSMQALNIASQSPVNQSVLDYLASQNQLSPVSALAYRQTQQDASPISPSTPQFFSPIDSSQPSPTNFGLQGPYNLNAFGGQTQPGFVLGDAFDGDTGAENDPIGAAASALLGDRSRRGSHASTHSNPEVQHHLLLGQAAPEIRFMSASPVPPQPTNTASIPSMPTPDYNIPPCPNQGNGCHCYTPAGSPQTESQRCGQPNCPCCSHLTQQNTITDLSQFGIDFSTLGGSENMFSMTSPQRDPNAPAFPLPVTNVDESQSLLVSLQVPAGSVRSRSNSASSQASAASTHSLPNATLNSGLSRHNSTGQIGRGGPRYKNILPKPTHPQGSSSSGDLLGLQKKPPSLPTSNAASSPASPTSSIFPQWQSQPQSTAHLDMLLGKQVTPPSLVVTQPAAPDFSQMLHSPMIGDDAGAVAEVFGSGSMQDDFRRAEYTAIVDQMFGNPAGVTSNQLNRTHARNHSSPGSFAMFNTSPAVVLPEQQQQAQPQPEIQLPTLPANFPPSPTHGRAQSFATAASSSGFLAAPRPQHHTHTRSSSASLLEGRPSFELVVTPASPFHAGGSSG